MSASHWAKVPLCEVADLQLGKMLDRARHGAAERLPYVRNVNVRWFEVDLTDLLAMPFDDEEREKFALREGDVLICEGGEPGRAAVWRGFSEEVKFQKAVHRVRLRGEIDPEWLVYHLKADAVSGKLHEYFSGTTIKHFTGVALSRYELAIPPVNEQRRILAKLNAMRSRVNAARLALAHTKTLLEEFRQSILAAAFHGDLTADWREKNPDVGAALFAVASADDEFGGWWASVPLRRVLESLEQGWSPKCDAEPTSNPERWGVIKTTAVQPLTFHDSENKALPTSLAPRPDLEIRADDILITRAGPRARAGVTCLVRSVRPRLMVCDKVYRLRVDRNKVTPAFMSVVLNAPLIVDAIDGLKTGISESGVNLTQERFLELPIPLPPLPEQQCVTARVERLLEQCVAIADRIGEATNGLNFLESAVLSKALGGELVPQDPNDEPASVLLERIRDERAAAAGEAQHSRRTKNAAGPRRLPRQSERQPGGGTSSTRLVDEDADEEREPASGTTEPGRPAIAPAGEPRLTIHDRTLDDLLFAIRRVLETGARDRETLIRDVARELGFARTGASIRETIDSAINAASRRLIIKSERGWFTLYSPSIEAYTRDELKGFFLSAIGTAWRDQEEAIRATARYLGFKRTGERIDNVIRSIINGLIRQNRIERDRSRIRRL